jgi:hypothetical protein
MMTLLYEQLTFFTLLPYRVRTPNSIGLYSYCLTINECTVSCIEGTIAGLQMYAQRA